MKSKALVPLVVGLVVGVIAIKYTMDTVNAAKGAKNTDMVSVVMARSDIPSTVQITPDVLVVQETPKTPLLAMDAVTTPDEIINRVALKSIPQGVPITMSMIAPEGTLPGLIVRVKEGFRAVGVKITESSGVGYLIHPGDWVDVIVVMDVKRRAKSETISRVILQRVQVGAVGQLLNERHTEENGNRVAQTVTLIVKEEDVPKLHLAQSRGRITLAMRGAEDLALNNPAETTGSEVFGNDEGEENKPQDQQADSAMANMLAQFNAMKNQLGNTDQTDAKAQEIKEPEAQHEPKTVTIINGSTKEDSEPSIVHVTYRDENSMEVIEVSEGDRPSTPRRRRRSSRRARPPVVDRASYDVDEDETIQENNSEPSEDSE
ncbi:MAG: Flp pilus assembly protein CpaB [Phycisphaerales bacterium]|nr:Flp pilus assembly protein CpaB [Phycisphaerales bacterium]